jgi:non-ribosomal peptide synthetase component E (peptide arylation enzyme)
MTFAVDLDAPKSERLSTQGKVAPWDEFKLLDENGKEVPRGEIGVLYWRGPTGTAGYYDDMERNLKIWGTLGMEGWFNTEDLAKVTEYGNVMLAGRISDMIQRGGQNVYPLEIENTLNAHPKVMQVCIVPMPDPDLGEKACAYVIPKEGETFTFDDMVSYLTEQKLAKYKFPQRLEIVEDFPVVGDKVDKRTLGGRVAKKLLAEGKVNQAMVDKLVEDKRIVLG